MLFMHQQITIKTLKKQGKPNVDIKYYLLFASLLVLTKEPCILILMSLCLLDIVTQFQAFLFEYLIKKKSPISCQALSGSLFIDPYGNIYPCTMWNKKIASIRNINMDLKQIWPKEFNY